MRQDMHSEAFKGNVLTSVTTRKHHQQDLRKPFVDSPSASKLSVIENRKKYSENIVLFSNFCQS